MITDSQAGKAQEAQVVEQLRKPSPQAVQQALLKVRTAGKTTGLGRVCSTDDRFETWSALQTFDLHVGATLPLPTKDKRNTHQPELLPTPGQKLASATLSDPFAGLPFRNLAEKLGAPMAPAVEQMRADKRKARAAGQAAAAAAIELPSVPHVLPFTRW